MLEHSGKDIYYNLQYKDHSKSSIFESGIRKHLIFLLIKLLKVITQF